MERRGTIAVCGATGRQGGAVARHLVADGWAVRGLTRSPQSAAAQRLSVLGVDVVQAEMADAVSLDRAFAGVHGVYSVQNGMTAGFDAEVVQRGLGIPLTILRPEAFMELMTDSGYYPAVGVWSVMPKLMGDGRPVPWLAVDDLGAIAARVFADADRFTGEDIPLAADVKTIDECRAAWREVHGSNPRSFPMPVWLFQRVAGHAGDDLPNMWRWLRSGSVPEDTRPTRDIHPEALTVHQWLANQV